jgi:hypothetical protein
LVGVSRATENMNLEEFITGYAAGYKDTKN